MCSGELWHFRQTLKELLDSLGLLSSKKAQNLNNFITGLEMTTGMGCGIGSYWI